MLQLDKVIAGYRHSRAWLVLQAEDLESNEIVMTHDGVDVTQAEALELRQHIANIDAVIAYYDEIRARVGRKT
jgi:hypothetical protein